MASTHVNANHPAVDGDEELIFDDDDYVWPDGPKLSQQKRDIHLLLLTTTLRAELEGHRFVDERELLKLDEIMKPLIRTEVRRHPTTPVDTERVYRDELRRVRRAIDGLLGR